MKLLIIGLLECAAVYGTVLTGTIQAPDGTGFTGTLTMALAQQAALISGSVGGVACGGPVEVVPNLPKQITVTNGTFTGGPTVYGNDCLLPGGTYYNISMKDKNGNTFFTDKWVIVGASINVGTIVSLVITGTTQTLGSTGYVSLVPSVTQVINQPQTPAQTYFGVNYMAITGTLTLPDGTACTTSGCFAAGNVMFLTGNQTAAGVKHFADQMWLDAGAYGRYFKANTQGLSGGQLTFENDTGSFGVTWDGVVLAQWYAGHLFSVAVNDPNHPLQPADHTFQNDDSTWFVRRDGKMFSQLYNSDIAMHDAVNPHTFQNSDGNFYVDYTGVVAAQQVQSLQFQVNVGQLGVTDVTFWNSDGSFTVNREGDVVANLMVTDQAIINSGQITDLNVVNGLDVGVSAVFRGVMKYTYPSASAGELLCYLDDNGTVGHAAGGTKPGPCVDPVTRITPPAPAPAGSMVCNLAGGKVGHAVVTAGSVGQCVPD